MFCHFVCVCVYVLITLIYETRVDFIKLSDFLYLFVFTLAFFVLVVVENREMSRESKKVVINKSFCCYLKGLRVCVCVVKSSFWETELFTSNGFFECLIFSCEILHKISVNFTSFRIYQNSMQVLIMTWGR